MIIGIVTEVAIFFFSEFVDLSASRPVPRALTEAGQKPYAADRNDDVGGHFDSAPSCPCDRAGFVDAAAARCSDHFGLGSAAPLGAPGNAERLFTVIPLQ